MIFIPGGFSFGDYLRAGALATKSPAIKDLISYSKKGVPIVGICNGFQILTECKLLEGTLLKNSNRLFKCQDSFLKVENNESIFTRNINKTMAAQKDPRYLKGIWPDSMNAKRDCD